jgi:hypothetical protein
MEKKAIITRTTFVSEWTNQQGGKVYYHEIELNNGDRGQIGSKEKMPEKLNPGQELTYTIEATSRGNKIKAVTAQSGFQGKKQYQDPRAQFIGFSAAYAKDLVVAGKMDLKDMNGGAESIFKNMLKLYTQIQ